MKLCNMLTQQHIPITERVCNGLGYIKYGNNNKSITHVRKEINILKQISKHINIIEIVDICGKSIEGYFCEYAGEPLNKISIDSMLWIPDVLCGIEHIHELGIVHSDLTRDNILWNGTKATIIDFGNANTGQTMWYCAAPEFLENRMITTKNDIFTFGMTILYCENPNHELLSLDPQTCMNKLKKFEININPCDLYNIIKQCVLPYHQRPSAKNLYDILLSCQQTTETQLIAVT